MRAIRRVMSGIEAITRPVGFITEATRTSCGLLTESPAGLLYLRIYN